MFYRFQLKEDPPSVSRPLWENFFRRRDPESQVLEILAGVPLFRDLNQRGLRFVRELMHIRNYREGEVVFEEGDPGQGMYIILEGEVKVLLRGNQKGEEVEIVRLKTGDFFGEFSLIDESPRSATVVATTPSRLGGFFRPDLKELVERNPRHGVKVLWNLAQVLTERLRRSNDELRRLRGLVDSSR
jgi:CRP-like cAMP-binding protein